MFRKIKACTTFGTQSTALKILYGIKDLHCKTTNEINNINGMINVLSSAIKKVVDYPKYQKLNEQEKTEFRDLIIRKLDIEARKHWVDDESCSGYGIRIKRLYDASYDAYTDDVGVEFPCSLFLRDESLLCRHIANALKKNHSALLLPITFPPDLRELADVRKNARMLFVVHEQGLFSKVPAEIWCHIASFSSEPRDETGRAKMAQWATNHFCTISDLTGVKTVEIPPNEEKNKSPKKSLS